MAASRDLGLGPKLGAQGRGSGPGPRGHAGAPDSLFFSFFFACQLEASRVANLCHHNPLIKTTRPKPSASRTCCMYSESDRIIQNIVTYIYIHVSHTNPGGQRTVHSDVHPASHVQSIWSYSTSGIEDLWRPDDLSVSLPAVAVVGGNGGGGLVGIGGSVVETAVWTAMSLVAVSRRRRSGGGARPTGRPTRGGGRSGIFISVWISWSPDVKEVICRHLSSKLFIRVWIFLSADVDKRFGAGINRI